MDGAEQIKKFEEFLQSNCESDILKAIRTGKKSFQIDFLDLSRFDLDLAESLLDSPDDAVTAAEIATEQFDLPEGMNRLKARFKNLPKSQTTMVRHIRSEHLNKMLSIEGVVRQKSDVRPQVTTSKFECPSCGNIINVLQLDSKFKEPTRCGCGRKGKFRLLSKEMVDAQGLVLEEAPEDLEGGEQPKRMNVFLKQDLVSPMTEKKTNPGSKVRVVGQIKEVPILLRTGGQSTRFDLIIEANNIEGIEEDYSDIVITPEELQQIKKISQDPNVYDLLIQSAAPKIYGHDKIKLALMLQMLGGVRKVSDDGAINRGDMHILLIGDPGCGKSQLLKRMSIVAPKARFVGGKGASGAGLTASVVKDEFLKGWSLEAGALVLANKGICMIDEMDKMSPEDTASMHEALEQQTVSISKANIQATLRCETTVLAAANPKFGRFDPYSLVGEQINLPPTLINRFDLIFPVKDLPDAIKDRKLATFILSLHQSKLNEDPPLETKFLRKYISYAKKTCIPQMTDEAVERIKDYYVQMRNSGNEDGGINSIPISARQLEGLVRLAEASAKLRLCNHASIEDAERAIELLEYCLGQVARDQETGKIDIDRIGTGISASQRSGIHSIKEIISNLENQFGKHIPIEDIIKQAEEKGVSSAKAEEIIEKLKRSGDIFEPKNGFISRI